MVYVYIQRISDYNRIAADKYDIKIKRPATKTKKKMKEKTHWVTGVGQQIPRLASSHPRGPIPGDERR